LFGSNGQKTNNDTDNLPHHAIRAKFNQTAADGQSRIFMVLMNRTIFVEAAIAYLQ